MKEYAFELYKVTTTSGGTSRYSLEKRKAVALWAKKQIGKDYDYDYENNKLNTTSNNKKFNCSELVYKAWKFNGTISVDLDSNGGTGVYPNNIKDSKYTKLIYTGE